MFRNLILIALITFTSTVQVQSQVGTCAKLYKITVVNIFDICINYDENKKVERDAILEIASSVQNILTDCHSLDYDKNQVDLCINEYFGIFDFFARFLESVKTGDLYLILADLFPLVGQLVGATKNCFYNKNVNEAFNIVRY